MCGIVGYIGKAQAPPILLDGLKRLEYRGYDSAGLSVWSDNKIKTIKHQGRVSEIAKDLQDSDLQGTLGIAHTRWATHGEPNEINAHPHFSCKKDISIVHNGIIENFESLKKVLIKEGHKFTSETDSEVLAHLVEKYYEGDLEAAVKKALAHVEGAYGIVVMAESENKLVAVKKGSPLVLGVGKDEFLIASDTSAIVAHTKHVIYLDDNEMAVISPDKYEIKNLSHNDKVSKDVEKIDWSVEQIEKEGYDTFMLKEIFEQPTSITNALRGRVLLESGEIKIDGLEIIKEKLPNISRVIIIACGTSWHAGLVGEFILEELVGIPVETEYASEFRYRNPVIGPDCLVIAISQSGETADTLAALQLAKEKGATTFGICNVVGSSIARQVDAGCYLHAGPEIGVASTKAFTSQITALLLFAVHLGNLRNVLSADKSKAILDELIKIPAKVEKILEQNDKILELAKKYKDAKNFLYLGRGNNFPVALEGALKLKEISYIHAEGYPAAEMKHGPIALIDEHMPVVFIANKDATYDKVVNNISEVKARLGNVIAIATEGDEGMAKNVDEVIYVPTTIDLLTPIINTVPLQLLAYHIAVLKKCDVDKPRNLAKSVTVE